MADYIEPTKKQSVNEIRVWDFDFGPDLKTGVTVVSATAIHIPPSGSAATPVVGAIIGDVVPVSLSFGSSAPLGTHLLSCLTTLSDGEKSELRIAIKVIY
jgi:hypothetical protein